MKKENKKEMNAVMINNSDHMEAIKHLLQATDQSGIFMGVYYDAEEKAIVSSDKKRLYLFKGFDGSEYGMISGVYHVIKDKKSVVLNYQAELDFPKYKQIMPSIEGKEVINNIRVSGKKDYQVVDCSKVLVKISNIMKNGVLNFDYLKNALIPNEIINVYVEADSLSPVYFVAQEKVFGMDYEAIVMPIILED